MSDEQSISVLDDPFFPMKMLRAKGANKVVWWFASTSFDGL